MTEVNVKNFGVLIAFLLPGLVTLLGIAPYSATVRSWFGTSATTAPTVGGFLYVTLAAIGLGMTTSVIRWLVLDWLHHHTGIRPPEWDFSGLQANLDGFMALVENHYRYYQFYGNMVVAQGIIAIGYALSPTLPSEKSRLVLPIFLALMGLFYVASRDTLAKYYDRASTLLHAANFKGEETMTNGFGMKHDEEIAKKTPARPAKTSRQDARKAKPQSSTTSVKR
jgi:hypothetical protein